jgi:hypothetical protein
VFGRTRHNRVPYTRVYVNPKKWTDSLLAYDLSHRAHIYKYTISQLHYNHVITVSYLKCRCVLTWYYVFAIKLKYYEKRKVRHFTIPLHYFNDNHIYISIMIAITFIILATLAIILQVIKDRKDYHNYHNKRGTSRS